MKLFDKINFYIIRRLYRKIRLGNYSYEDYKKYNNYIDYLHKNNLFNKYMKYLGEECIWKNNRKD